MRKIVVDDNSISITSQKNIARAFSIKEFSRKYGSLGYSNKKRSSGAEENEEVAAGIKKHTQLKNLKSSPDNLAALLKREKAMAQSKGKGNKEPLTHSNPQKVDEFVQEIQMAQKYCKAALRSSFSTQFIARATHQRFPSVNFTKRKGSDQKSGTFLPKKDQNGTPRQHIGQNCSLSLKKNEPNIHSSSNLQSQTKASYMNTTFGPSHINIGKLLNDSEADLIHKSLGNLYQDSSPTSGSIKNYQQFKKNQLGEKDFRDFLDWEEEDTETGRIDLRNTMISLFCSTHDNKIFGRMMGPKVSPNCQKTGFESSSNQLKGGRLLSPSQWDSLVGFGSFTGGSHYPRQRGNEEKKVLFDDSLKLSPLNTPMNKMKGNRENPNKESPKEKIPKDFLFLGTGFPKSHNEANIKGAIGLKEKQWEWFQGKKQLVVELKNQRMSEMFKESPEEEEQNTSRDIIETIKTLQNGSGPASASASLSKTKKKGQSIHSKYKEFKREIQQNASEMARKNQELLNEMDGIAKFGQTNISRLRNNVKDFFGNDEILKNLEMHVAKEAQS